MSDLIALMSQLVDNKGKLLVPGIYDTVAKLTPEEEKLYEAIDFDMVSRVIALIRAHLHPATATSLQNQFCCFGVVLLHPTFATASVTKLPVTGKSLCNPFGSDITTTSQTRHCRWM